MSGIILLVGQIGVVVAGFVGVATAVGWYNGVEKKGGNNSGSTSSRMHGKGN